MTAVLGVWAWSRPTMFGNGSFITKMSYGNSPGTALRHWLRCVLMGRCNRGYG
jgi:hypothetical protein